MIRFRFNILKEVFQNVNANIRCFCTQQTGGKERKTSLYNFHKQNGGKLINFGGYLLPVSYANKTLVASHLHTRQYASVFDVSHMLQTYIYGKDAISCFEELCTADIQGAENGTGNLTVFTNSYGGILDDLIVTKINENSLYIVSNAAMKEQDKNIMQCAILKNKSNGKDVFIQFMDSNEQSLIALQGPYAVNILKKCVPNTINFNKFYFMSSILTNVAGIPDCRITRCGYTGEDGFEISVSSEHVEKLTEALLSAAPKKCLLAGLGVRDSLRLEAGLCLYGSDINEKITPVEASLGWLVAKRRRREMNFPGAKHICDQLGRKQSFPKIRVGVICTGQANSPPARSGASVYYKEVEVGHITSGGPSPTLQRNIAMGYINRDLSVPGTVVQLKIRNKLYYAEVTKIPFVKTNYYVRPKK